MQVPAPLHELAALPRLEFVDLRGTHVEELSYWTEAKCTTMRHVAGYVSTNHPCVRSNSTSSV